MKLSAKCQYLAWPALLLAAGAALAGPPQAVTECETWITEPGNYYLANDLVECEDVGVLILASDVTLDLKGHTISCADNGARSGGVVAGLYAPVSNVTVRNGGVTGCADGILLAGHVDEDGTVLAWAQDSKIKKITSWDNRLYDGPGSGTGITLWYAQNSEITHNLVYGNAIQGIGSWESSGNLFKHNTSTDNGTSGYGVGIDLTGETNSRFLCNRIHGNVDGILMAPSIDTGVISSGNLLRGNVVTGNFSGIGMMGFAWDGYYWLDIPNANTVRSNIVEGNWWANLFEIYYDLYNGDVLLHPEDTCMNAWVKNQFGPPLLGPEGCFGTSVVLDYDDVCALDDDD
jgi:parallel beta-helix repeat protein